MVCAGRAVEMLLLVRFGGLIDYSTVAMMAF